MRDLIALQDLNLFNNQLVKAPDLAGLIALEDVQIDNNFINHYTDVDGGEIAIVNNYLTATLELLNPLIEATRLNEIARLTRIRWITNVFESRLSEVGGGGADESKMSGTVG